MSFGPCTRCADDAVVKVNNTPVCIKHMNEVFVGIGETVREIAAQMAAPRKEGRHE